jgi:acylphosphatase
MIDKQQAHIVVSGRVQGVFFRDFTCRKAQSLGLYGWVKNTREGNVEIIAEGDRQKLKKLIEAVKIGPSSADVQNCKVEWLECFNEFNHFQVIY